MFILRQFEDSNFIAEALEIAARVHLGQYRKGRHVPYIVHPIETAMILQSNNLNKELVAAGLLHDTLEDGEKDQIENIKEEIKNKMGKYILELVIGASERLENRENTPWKIRKQYTIQYLKNIKTPKDIKLVSCADKLSNVRSLHRDYKRIGETLWERFNAPYEAQKWYYKSLVKSLEDIRRYKMYKEFKFLVDSIFK